MSDFKFPIVNESGESLRDRPIHIQNGYRGNTFTLKIAGHSFLYINSDGEVFFPTSDKMRLLGFTKGGNI